MSDLPGQESSEDTSDMSAPSISMAEFLELIPPGNWKRINEIASTRTRAGAPAISTINSPQIRLWCDHTACNGPRFFRIASDLFNLRLDDARNVYLIYVCSNCRTASKIFSISAKLENPEDMSGACYKFGELPEYGPPVPSRLISLIGPDRTLFLKGRRCENQGLGIAAFVYYRRVVEQQRNRIFDKIIRVLESISSPEGMIEQFKAARAEQQFKKSLEIVKDAVPQSLLINGRNPFLLLHSALSEGLHQKNDGECLELAQDVRLVLAELSERLATALKDDVELNAAVGRLMSRKPPAIGD